MTVIQRTKTIFDSDSIGLSHQKQTLIDFFGQTTSCITAMSPSDLQAFKKSKSYAIPSPSGRKNRGESLLKTVRNANDPLISFTHYYIHPPLISRRKVSPKKTLLKTTLPRRPTEKNLLKRRRKAGPPNNAADFSPLPAPSSSRGNLPAIFLQKLLFHL